MIRHGRGSRRGRCSPGDVPEAQAARFTGGNVVVYRVGVGAALTNAAAPVFLDEYGPDRRQGAVDRAAHGSRGGERRLTATGQSRSEGLIARSADGRFLAVTGYDAAVGATGAGGITLTGVRPDSVARVVGLVDANGTVDTTTVLDGRGAAKIIRSAATTTASSSGPRVATAASLTTTPRRGHLARSPPAPRRATSTR